MAMGQPALRGRRFQHTRPARSRSAREMVLSGDRRIARDVPPRHARRARSTGSVSRDRTGAYLDGGKSYKLTVPLPVPGKLFWSVTVYDTDTRSQIQTDQKKAALRSLFELKDAAGKTVELYFGPTRRRARRAAGSRRFPAKGGSSISASMARRRHSTAAGSRVTSGRWTDASVDGDPSLPSPNAAASNGVRIQRSAWIRPF